MKKLNQKSLKLDAHTIRTLAGNELTFSGGRLADSGFGQCNSTQNWNWCTRFAYSECAC